MEARPLLAVHVSWRAGAPRSERARTRLVEELQAISWTLNQMEALLYDAHQLAGHDDAWLMPRLELRLPLYDVGQRYKLVQTWLDEPQTWIEDDRGRRVADVVLP